MNNIIVTTGAETASYDIAEYLGLVRGIVVRGATEVLADGTAVRLRKV